MEESVSVEPPATEGQEEAIVEAPTGEYPAEDYPIAEPTPEAEAALVDEVMLAKSPPIEEATVESGPEAAQEPNVPSESRAEDSDENAALKRVAKERRGWVLSNSATDSELKSA